MPMDPSERELLQETRTALREIHTQLAVVATRLQAAEGQMQRIYVRVVEGNGDSHETRLRSHEARVIDLEDWQKEVRVNATTPAILKVRMDGFEAWRDGVQGRFWKGFFLILTVMVGAIGTAIVALIRTGAIEKNRHNWPF